MMVQTDSEKYLIIGAGSVGGHIAYNFEDYRPVGELLGFLDDDPSKIGSRVFDYEVLGPISSIEEYEGVQVVLGLAFPAIKKRLYYQITELGEFEFPTLISKYAWVSSEVDIGKGSIIYPGCSINYNCSVGDFVIMNLNCALGHDTKIGDFSSLAPGVKTAGKTHIGLAVDIGIGVSTRQSVIIGSSSLIGGQSFVSSDIPEKSLAYGVPAKVIRKL